MSDQIATPRLGSLSQGVIFSCARAEDYEGCDVCGLIITARCDIAQSKVPVYNYLPVVPLDDWIHRDCRTIICDRLERNVLGRMRKLIKSRGHSETVVQTAAPSAILAALFPPVEGDRVAAKSREQFSVLAAQHEQIRQCAASAPAEGRIIALADASPGDRDSLIRELTSQRLNGYYFLPSVRPGEHRPGYVALLRQIQHIPRELAEQVGRGLTSDEYTTAGATIPIIQDRLAFTGEDFAMPIGVLTSPHVEHLMQVFSALFSRIGLPDLDAAYIDAIWEAQPSVRRTRT